MPGASRRMCLLASNARLHDHGSPLHRQRLWPRSPSKRGLEPWPLLRKPWHPLRRRRWRWQGGCNLVDKWLAENRSDSQVLVSPCDVRQAEPRWTAIFTDNTACGGLRRIRYIRHLPDHDVPRGGPRRKGCFRLAGNFTFSATNNVISILPDPSSSLYCTGVKPPRA